MSSEANWVRQAAAIPMKADKVCLVTSTSGKRWVVPKGNMELGKTAGEVALQEAWEEAGLLGLLQPEPIGSYVYEKDGFRDLRFTAGENEEGESDVHYLREA